MKRLFALLLSLALLLAGCAAEATPTQTAPSAGPAPTTETTESAASDESAAVDILLSDEGVICASDAVYTANDIIYYEADRDESYGGGTDADAHTAVEAAAHAVVHITAPGTYRVSGTLSAGQIFVDLGEGAEDDPAAVVTLLLDKASITCTVAPAILFYRVYECGNRENFTLTPDLRGAGAVVALADGSENLLRGAYVAPIYAPGTTETAHEYDGALYARQSLRLEGGAGQLLVSAENEGICSALHLEINGGILAVNAQNDGINTNADGISVTTVNSGTLYITGGMGAEGDGIDSNGALVVNGGTLYATANERAGDSGVDADLGIYLNGGTVIATGSGMDSVHQASKLQYMELNFARTVTTGSVVSLGRDGESVYSYTALRDFTSLIIAGAFLELNVPYTLTVNGVVQQHRGSGWSGGFEIPGIGGEDGPPDVEIPPQPTQPLLPAGAEEPTEGISDAPPPSEGETPPSDGLEPPEGAGLPDNGIVEITPIPGGSLGGPNEITLPGFIVQTGASTEFILTETIHSFFNICDAME